MTDNAGSATSVCANCGAPILAGGGFCAVCGQAVTPPPAQWATSPSPVPASPAPTPLPPAAAPDYSEAPASGQPLAYGQPGQPPAYGQPQGYGTYPGYQPGYGYAAARRSNMPLLAGLGAVALVLVIAAGALIVVSSGGHATSSGSPAATPAGTILGAVSLAPLVTPTEVPSPLATKSLSPSATPTAGYAGIFSPTGSMITARDGHTATLLQDGRVLVAGGVGNCKGTTCDALASAELFDPTTGKFSPTGSMTTGRASQTATLLQDGRVLVVGGEHYASSTLNALASAEIYDPKTGKFSPAGSMKTARFAHTETLLPDGHVLITGGFDASFTALSSAELFDPASGTFSKTGSMTTGRDGHTATLLGNGLVLIAGGAAVASAELYDPFNGAFTTTGSMHVVRADPTATLLSDGRVLLVGGQNNCTSTGCDSIDSAEVYVPTTESFTLTGSMSVPRWGHVASLLSDGRVLVAAGASGQTYYTSAEVWDPSSGTFSPTSPLSQGGARPTATRLQDGTVLVAGGWNGTEIGTADLYS